MMRPMQGFSNSISLQKFKSNGAGRQEGMHRPPDREPEPDVRRRDPAPQRTRSGAGRSTKTDRCAGPPRQHSPARCRAWKERGSPKEVMATQMEAGAAGPQHTFGAQAPAFLLHLKTTYRAPVSTRRCIRSAMLGREAQSPLSGASGTDGAVGCHTAF